MFREERKERRFKWSDLGDIKLGRPNLGPLVPVIVYRLMQYTLRDVLIKCTNVAKADEVFYEAGFSAGEALCNNVLDKKLDFDGFVRQLQTTLKELKVGVLRVEAVDKQKLEITLTVEEDLDCSGLPVTDETICVYDEGFIAGILFAYTGKKFKVKEVDCWATGDRTCRFDVRPAA